MSGFCISTGETQFKTGHFSLMPNEMRKWVMFDTMACKDIEKYQINFPLFIVSELWKFHMSGFSLVKQFKKGHSDNLELSENSVNSVNSGEFWVLSYVFCPIHIFPWHMESCLEDRVESVCFGLWGSPSVKDVFEVLRFFKWEFKSEWPRQQNVKCCPWSIYVS